MDKLQTGIVKAVSTIMFQKNKSDLLGEISPGVYWNRPKRVTIVEHSEDSNEFNLSTKQIDNYCYLEVWMVVYNEYGDEVFTKTLGYIPFNSERACWEIAGYCNQIESIITLGTF